MFSDVIEGEGKGGEGVVLLITGCYYISQLQVGDRGIDMWIDY